MNLVVLDGSFTVYRLAPGDPLPSTLGETTPHWVARTVEELSIVCRSSVEIESAKREAGWSCIQVAGPLDFALTGILAGITAALAEADISLFALSTFDTDYILVKTDRLARATDALLAAGYKM